MSNDVENWRKAGLSFPHPSSIALSSSAVYLDQLGGIARHSADCKTADDDQVADPFGMARRIGERRDAADRGAEKGEPADLAGLDHRLEILDAPIEREIRRVAIRQAAAAAVVADQLMALRQQRNPRAP